MDKNTQVVKKLFAELLNVLEINLDILPDKNEENAENTLSALWCYASGMPISIMSASKDELIELDKEQELLLRELIEKRQNRVPLAHLIGIQSFMGIECQTEHGIYITRKETELLAKTALKIMEAEFHDENIIIADVCTGGGAIAITLAYYNKNVTAFGSDISEKAINLARKNVKTHKLDGSVSMLCGDLMEPFKLEQLQNKVDIVLSAPPYISSAKISSLPSEIKEHEPEAAFNAGAFGLDIFNRIIKDATTFLKNGGYLLFEVGLGQGEFLIKRIKKNKNYSSVKGIRDENDDIRVLVIKK